MSDRNGKSGVNGWDKVRKAASALEAAFVVVGLAAHEKEALDCCVQILMCQISNTLTIIAEYRDANGLGDEDHLGF